MHRLFVVAALAAGTPAWAAAQTLKKCDDPKTPIGILPSGNAVIWYRLGHDGRPDTAGMGVVQVAGLSVAGVRSVALRLLSGCHFDTRKGDDPNAGLVTELRFDSARVSLGATNHADGPAALRAPEPLDLPRDTVLGAGDRRVEEKPRGLKCASPRPPEIRASGRGATQAEARASAQPEVTAQVDNWNRMNTGQLVADVVVTPAGRIDDNIQVVQVSNPAATGSLSELVRSCSWVPGRVLGVPVRARARTVMVIGPIQRQ